MLTTPPDLFLFAHPYDLSHLKAPFSWHPLLLPAVESRCVWSQGVLSGIPCHKAGSKSGLRYMVQPWWKALRQSGDSQVGALVDWHSAGSLMTSSFIIFIPSPQSSPSPITTTSQGSSLQCQRAACWPCHLEKCLCWFPERAENISAYKALLEGKKWQTAGLHQRVLSLSCFGGRLCFPIDKDRLSVLLPQDKPQLWTKQWGLVSNWLFL